MRVKVQNKSDESLHGIPAGFYGTLDVSNPEVKYLVDKGDIEIVGYSKPESNIKSKKIKEVDR